MRHPWLYLLMLWTPLAWAANEAAGMQVLAFGSTLALLVCVGLALQQRRLLRRARDSEQRMRQLLEAAPTAMVKVDAEGLITLVNAQAERCFGYTRAELLGQSVEILVPLRFRAGHVGFRQAFLRQPQARAMGAGHELFGLRKDGSEFPLEIGLNPLHQGGYTEVLVSVLDITARKRLEDRFRLVVEATPNAVVVSNQQGRIELVNSQTETLFGYSRDELLGQPIDILVPVRFRAGHGSLRSGYLAQPQTRSMGSGRDLFALRKDGSEFPVEIGLNPFVSDSGTLVLSSIIDISARKQAQLQLQQQAEQLATANRYKSEFLANMSHELRTPLNSILILSEQLRDNAQGNLTGKQLEHVDVIYRSGNDLLSLINDILDLSKIEAGQVVVAQEPISLQEVSASLRRVFAPLAERKRLGFQIEIDPDVPAQFQSDFQRLLQIMKNLIANAIKFTERGSVRLLIQVAPDQALQAPAIRLLLRVIDTGPGVPPDKQELIFQAFQQADGSTSRQYGGTGLGLTISRQLAALLGGEITLNSQPGQGSEFVLSLPVQTILPPLVELAPPPVPRASVVPPLPASAAADTGLGRGRLLLVDDDVRNIYAMTSMLEQEGFDVLCARNGADALRLLAQESGIRLVLMDMMMPVMDGDTAIRRMRHELKLSLPVIAVTACAMKGDREKSLDAGADDYLPKPVTRSDMLNVINRWLNPHPAMEKDR
ncbi:MAG: PAS domain S-box protein [Chitinivorax sp.]